jgi:hypothetical protein
MAISRRPLTAEARVRFRVRTCRICGQQSGTGTGFFPGFLVDSDTGTGFSPGFWWTKWHWDRFFSGILVDKVTLGQVFLRVIRFSPVNIISP